MQDISARVAAMKRPRTLVRAARFGLETYNRKVRLSRLLRGRMPEKSGEVAMLLLDLEAEQDEKRVAKAADYSVAVHVDILTALLGEVQLLRDSSRAAAAVASPREVT